MSNDNEYYLTTQRNNIDWPEAHVPSQLEIKQLILRIAQPSLHHGRQVVPNVTWRISDPLPINDPDASQVKLCADINGHEVAHRLIVINHLPSAQLDTPLRHGRPAKLKHPKTKRRHPLLWGLLGLLVLLGIGLGWASHETHEQAMAQQQAQQTQQIDRLQDQLGQLQAQLDQYQKDHDKDRLQANLNQLKAQNEQLKTQVQGLQQRQLTTINWMIDQINAHPDWGNGINQAGRFYLGLLQGLHFSHD